MRPNTREQSQLQQHLGCNQLFQPGSMPKRYLTQKRAGVALQSPLQKCPDHQQLMGPSLQRHVQHLQSDLMCAHLGRGQVAPHQEMLPRLQHPCKDAQRLESVCLSSETFDGATLNWNAAQQTDRQCTWSDIIFPKSSRVGLWWTQEVTQLGRHGLKWRRIAGPNKHRRQSST